MSDEGIGGRKFSLLPLADAAGDGVGGGTTWIERGDDVILMDGSALVARIATKDPKRVALLVTAPQLWDAANELMKFLNSPGSAPLASQPKVRQLGDVLAKAVGKSRWEDVAQ